MRSTRRTAGTTVKATAALILLGGLAPVASAVVTPAAAPATVAAPASAATASTATSCGVMWGSLAKTDTDPAVGDGAVTGVRAGRHACFDRVVVDIAGVSADRVGYDVRYVDTVRSPGSGQEVELDGGARMQVEVTVPAYDSRGRATYAPADRNDVVDVTGWDTLRQVAMVGSYEGRTTFGVGVRARLPMRVFTLDGPGTGSRLVIDVAHRW